MRLKRCHVFAQVDATGKERGEVGFGTQTIVTDAAVVRDLSIGMNRSVENDRVRHSVAPPFVDRYLCKRTSIAAT